LLCWSVGGLPAENARAQTRQLLTPAAETSLKHVMQNYLRGPFGEEYKPGRFYPVFANLADSEPPQIIVYVTGPHWCGSGGCTLLVVTSTGTSDQIVSKTIGVELPVGVLPSETAGWHDLAVQTREGPKLLAFNGRKYPINAYSFPSRRVAGHPTETLAIPATATGIPLYD